MFENDQQRKDAMDELGRMLDGHIAEIMKPADVRGHEMRERFFERCDGTSAISTPRYIVSSVSTHVKLPCFDSAVVMSLTPKGWAVQQRRNARLGVAEHAPPICIAALDGTGGDEPVMLSFTAEDAKKLVNALSEAIAETEALTAVGA